MLVACMPSETHSPTSVLKLNVANLLIVNLIGLPLDLSDCSDSVRIWLRNHNTADDIRVKKHQTSEQIYDENRISIWKYLNK